MKKVVLLGSALVIFDQFTKNLALQYCSALKQVTSFLECGIVYNRGISWGLLSRAQTNIYLFMAVTVMICFLTLGLVWYAYRRFRAGFSIYFEAAVFAGSCSNILDRFLHGGVIDFIVLHYGSWYWPAFNFADVAIVVGLLGMAVTHSFGNKPRP